MRLQTLRDLHLFFPDIDGFWNNQSLSDAERLIRAELPRAEDVPNSWQIEAVTQAVRLFCLQNKMKEAKEFLGCAEQYLKELRSEDAQKLKARYYLEEGRYYIFSKNPAKALGSFKNAWEIVGEVKKLDYLAIDTAFMISITLPNKQGKNWLKNALEMSENSENDSLASKWRCYLYMQAGWQSFDSHDFPGALSYFEKAQVCCDGEYKSLLRNLKWCNARVKRALGHSEAALAIQNEVLFEMSVDAEPPDAFVFLEIAECHQAKQEIEKASVNFEKAYEKLKDNLWYAENFSDDLKEILKKSKQKKYH